jgi:hypothetical protein
VRIELESPELFNPLNSSTFQLFNFSTLQLLNSSTSQLFNFSTFKLFNFSTLGKEINIASNFEISMADTLNMIKDIMQSDVSFVTNTKQQIERSCLPRPIGEIPPRRDNELERSCLPRPIGEIPRVPKKIGIDSAIRETNNPNEISSCVAFHGASKQQTTNNKHRTLNKLERSEIPRAQRFGKRTTNNEQQTNKPLGG